VLLGEVSELIMSRFFRADSCGPRNHVLDGVCLIICGCAKLTNINAKLNCEISRILDLEMLACSICAFHSVIGKSLQKKLLIRPKGFSLELEQPRKPVKIP